MSDFFTPKRGRSKKDSVSDSLRSRLSKSRSKSISGSEDSYVSDDENTDVVAPLGTEGAEAGPLSSWKKLRKRVGIHRVGSILYRNTARQDHLRELYLKRRIHDSIIHSMSEFNRKHVQIDTIAEEGAGYELSVRNDMLDSGLQKWDEGFLQELRAEVEDEMDHGTESAKIREIQAIGKEYFKHLKGLNEFPLEVRLKDVSYTVMVDENNSKIKTVYNASFLYPAAQAVRRLWNGERKQKKILSEKHVLSNISLVLKPGQQYLVLGPPGSGKSSLLRAISGLINPKKGESLDGTISYNGRTLEEGGKFHIKNAFAYIDQLDKHAPRLTVDETFEFAYQCSTGGKLVREEVSAETKHALNKADKEHLATRITMGTLGLTEVKDTFVGDADIRGVSGGQRRRVTVGEMLMSQAPVLCGDEVSTGLDAASTYDMTQVILHYGRLKKFTRIFALLQPSPETVSLFDEVIVLAEGQIIYAGPIEDVEDYFAHVGFKAPEFTDVADFLQMVSTEDGAALYDPDRTLKLIRPNAPTASELAEIFRLSDNGAKIDKALKTPLEYVWTATEGSKTGGEVSNLVMSEAITKRYANRFPKSTMLILRRFLVLWIRDKRVIIAGVVKNVLMGVSVGGVFANTADEISIQGALFQAGLFIMLGSMQSASGLLQDRVIYYKHTDANFYSAWPFVFGRALSQMPQTIFDTVTFATLLYYIIGLADRNDPVNFFTYLSILIAFALLMNAQLALFASFADGAQVQVYSSITILLGMLFCGFIIAPDAIPAYFQWLYWWNPFGWAYRALVVNEFRGGRWDDPDQILKDTGFTDPSGVVFGQLWVGYSFAFMVPYYLICCVLSAIALTFVRKSDKAAPDPLTTVAATENRENSKTEIPFKPVTLSFHDTCYEVTASTTKEQLKLLNSVNGVFRPGQMCALMGSSGAGKTTLMDVIALRKRSGIITGEVRLNGFLQDPTTFRRCSGYVEQFDVQSPELTVRETVLFSARLRLDPQLVETDELKQAFVDQIIKEVEMTDLAHAIVGSDEGAGLSFEQKKRLSIAVELAASPSVIFLDEPTSGLDARSANLVVKTLRKIANSNRTVCATIHQPSSAVFAMFDELLLLKKGGHVVYHGALGENCGTLVSYFESRGAPKISLGENPANWMLRVITAEERGDLADDYLKSPEFAVLKTELDGIQNSIPDSMHKIEYESEFATSNGRRRELIRRRLQLIYWRSPTYNYARIMVSLLIAFLLGSVFIFRKNLDVYEEVDMRARVSVVFVAFIITGIMAIISVLPVMTQIRDMFYRHRDAGMYDSASIGLALGVAEKYFILLSTSLFCVVFLATSSINGNELRGLIGFWGYFTFNFAIYSYMGQLFVCLVKPTATALILCSVFIGINNFFAGLIVRPQFMVGGFYALPYYICPGHYVYESMLMSIYADSDHKVLANVGSEFYEFLRSCSDSQEDGCECTEFQDDCIGTSSQYVDVFFGHEYIKDNNLRNALILGFILALTRVLTWVALKKIRFAS